MLNADVQGREGKGREGKETEQEVRDGLGLDDYVFQWQWQCQCRGEEVEREVLGIE